MGANCVSGAIAESSPPGKPRRMTAVWKSAMLRSKEAPPSSRSSALATSAMLCTPGHCRPEKVL